MSVISPLPAVKAKPYPPAWFLCRACRGSGNEVRPKPGEGGAKCKACGGKGMELR